MRRVVLDTNVLLRSILLRSGPSGRLWQRRHDFVICASADTIAEFVEVVNRVQLKAKAPQLTGNVAEGIRTALRTGVYVEQPAPVQGCRDPGDDMFLACALATEAEFVVTEDLDLLDLDGFRGLRITTPAEFLTLLDSLGE